MKLELTSPAFAKGQPIPAKHTRDDQDGSPPLNWQGVPPAAQSLALIADDPAPGKPGQVPVRPRPREAGPE